MKHGNKARNRLAARIAAAPKGDAFTAPGSLKKSYPRGKRTAGRNHSANTWSRP